MISATGRVKNKQHKAHTASAAAKPAPHKQTMQEQLEDALQQRDFSKATAMLEFFKGLDQKVGDLPVNPWLGYAAFHMGDFMKAAEVYKELIAMDDSDTDNYNYLAACYFYSGMYKEAEEWALKGTQNNLQNRILFHVSQKFNDESKLMVYHQKLQDTVEDQLALAALHYFRNHFQEATDIYKRILLQTREYLALNVYVALCYYKLDYYDVSLEVLNVYLHAHNDSAIAINLKACNHYRLYNGKTAETELKVLIDLQATAYNVENDIVKHNLVVFRGGENALQVLPPLLDVVVPEARLNLVIYHLKNDQVTEAYELLKDLEPVTPQEYILKAVVNSLVGQQLDSRDHIKMAQQYFQLVGGSSSECDTIPGRQCMASCFFLLKQFTDVEVYLKSVKPYFASDDTFLYLYGITLAATGQWAEAEEHLLQVKGDKIKSDICYTSWLLRSHIMNKHAKKAWDLYVKKTDVSSPDAYSILQLIANDCYRVGAFFYAAKAFDVLERLDGTVEFWEGKKGACVGVFQQLIAAKEPSDSFWDVIKMLENSSQQHQSDKPHISQQAEHVLRVMKTWAKDSGIKKK